jgi:hypothetical protein
LIPVSCSAVTWTSTRRVCIKRVCLFMPNSDDLGLVPPRCPTGSLGCMQYCSPKSLWIDTHGMLVPTQVFPIFTRHLFYFYLNSDAHREYILPLFSSSVYCANLTSSHCLSTDPHGYTVSHRRVLDVSWTRPQHVLDASSTRPRRILDNPTECVCTSVFSMGPRSERHSHHQSTFLPQPPPPYISCTPTRSST